MPYNGERYQAIYTHFNQAGKWRVMYQAQSVDGSWSNNAFGEVQASGTNTISARMNQSAYQIGEHFSFKLDLNEEPTQPSPYDIYAGLLFPQGNFITIAYPLTISLPGTILPYRKNVTVSGSQTFPILDLDLPQGLALGTYSGCGIVAPVDSDPWQMENWIDWHCQAFDLY
jgi:hypothetical protein